MRIAVRFLTVLVLVLSLGLHWALLQTVAWTGMIVRYSQSGSVTEAVSKTFDGQHPCSLCKLVEQGRAEEKKQESQQVKPGSKLDAGVVCESTFLHFVHAHELIAFYDSQAPPRQEEPPKPRPRTAFHDSLS